MKDKLANLYNTLTLVETKGESTKIMAQCLVFIENLINESIKNEEQKTES